MAQRAGKGTGSGGLIRGLDLHVPEDGRASLSYQPNLRAGIQLAARIKGQFAPRGAGFQTLLIAAHREMAEKAQGLMVDNLRESIAQRGREQRGTDLLLKALASPENIDYNIDGFVVTTSYLDRSPVRTYWRGLEEGTSVHVGRLITGYFSDASLAGRYAPAEGGKDARMIQLRRTPGVIRAVKENETAGSSQFGKGPWQFRIRHKIQGYQYLAKGARAYAESGFTKQRYDRFAQELLTRVTQ